MTGDDAPTDEVSLPAAEKPSRDSQDYPDDREQSTSSWDAWLDAIRTRVQEQIAVWPEEVSETIDLVDRGGSRDVPADGDVLVYVHGYLGEGRLDGINVSGTHQAGALRQALADEFEGSDASAPAVLAATWNSSTTWPRATKRAVTAGGNLARWVRTHAADYDRVTVVGHSLGGRVALIALNHLDDGIVDSAGLLGAAVFPESVYTEYRDGIESAVADGVFNYHSRNDAVVCRLYSFREGNDGIGCTGTSIDDGGELGTLPANYVDVDVSETVHRHMDYFKPRSETEAGNCVREIVERQLGTDSWNENE